MSAVGPRESAAAEGAQAVCEECEERRFAGIVRLYGAAGAARIRRAHVAVVGVGGVGAWAAEALARSGVARLTLIDLDHVAESNINRQVQALTDTLGQAKVQAMRERIARIHPGCRVDCVEEFVAPENWPGLLAARADALIDACDQARAKLLLALWARASATPCISVGAAGGKRHGHLVDIADLADASHDRLLAQLRQRLRKHHGAARAGKKIGIACVFSREAVAAAHRECALAGGAQGAGDGSLNCHGYGSSVAVTATFGQCAAGWVLNRLAGGPAPSAVAEKSPLESRALLPRATAAGTGRDVSSVGRAADF